MDENAQILQRMRSLLEPWETASDQRLIFLSCYQMMTSNVLDAIQAQEFEDGIWVQTLMENFAEVYFIALNQFEKNNHPPKVWQIAFEAPSLSHLHVIQNLVLGVNAHINYDLVFVLSDLLRSEWHQLNPDQQQVRYRDHCRINGIIHQTINAVQDQIIERFEPTFDLIDKLLGPLDEWLTAKIISSWRDEVWEYAVRMLNLPDEIERNEFASQVESESVQKALDVLKFSRDADIIEKMNMRLMNLETKT
jgi:hypothetical protein